MCAEELLNYSIDYIELYTPMANVLAYWHEQALGFGIVACADSDTGVVGMASYVCQSGDIRIVLTSSYPMANHNGSKELDVFIDQNGCGVKRLALSVPNVKEAFDRAVGSGAIPIKYPRISQDECGHIEEAGIKLFDDREILFINRECYFGSFKPGYKELGKKGASICSFTSVDHIASEVRVNEREFWTKYLANAIGTRLVQSIKSSPENKSGMTLDISQSVNANLTFVIAEPEIHLAHSKIQRNLEAFGPGIHHLAFATDDLVGAIERLNERHVEFITFPDSYYELLRDNEKYRDVDIDILKKNGIIIDKEGDTYILQKFLKPLGDRPFFLYEIVERVNGYKGFALNNINVLKKAEEIELMRKGMIEKTLG